MEESMESVEAALPSPAELRGELPASEPMRALVARSRAAIRATMERQDDRLLVVVGPCSIHDLEAAREYAARLSVLAARHEGELLVCMRSFFEKPRTSVGWKGMLNDPRLDGSCDLASGLRLARTFLLDLAALGLPVASEALDPMAQRYLSELVSWSAIGARTTESQTHRELASGLQMPVGFKNNTDGSLDVAIHAIEAAARPHTMLGTSDDGRPCVVRTRGNRHAHVVLRGGKAGPNFAQADIARAAARLRDARLPAHVMVDCSHANSRSDHEAQPHVLADVCDQVADGSEHVLGVMVESHLVAGKQALRPGALTYGQSITDACVDLATTERMLAVAARAVEARRRLRQLPLRVDARNEASGSAA